MFLAADAPGWAMRGKVLDWDRFVGTVANVGADVAKQRYSPASPKRHASPAIDAGATVWEHKHCDYAHPERTPPYVTASTSARHDLLRFGQEVFCFPDS